MKNHNRNSSKKNITRSIIKTLPFFLGIILILFLLKYFKNTFDNRSKAFDLKKHITFADIPPTHWAYPEIERIYSLGITTGCSSSSLKFCPTNQVTREEAAIFIIRALQGGSIDPIPEASPLFFDVPLTNKNRKFIEELIRKKITTGCSNNPLKYCPNDPIDRGSIAVMLVRAIHGSSFIPPPATGEIFTDVSKNHIKASYIEQLYRDGLATTKLSGNNDEVNIECKNAGRSYCPDKPISRATIAIMLARMLNREKLFQDVPVNYWAYIPIQNNVRTNIMTGCNAENVSFCPEKHISRGEMAKILIQLKYGTKYDPKQEDRQIFSDVEKDNQYRKYIEQLYRDGITTGCGSNPLKFCPNDMVDRASLAVYLLRILYGKEYKPPEPTGEIFTDVSKTTQHAGFIEKFFSESYTTSCSGNPLKFCPTDLITRESAAVFIDRIFQLNKTVTESTLSEKSWEIYNNKPLMMPQLTLEGDNIYAPEVIKEGSVWKMWYGGQAKFPPDGHDRIFYATSSDGLNWERHGVVLQEDGYYDHDPEPWPILVNDPSIVRKDGTYYMYYTEMNVIDRIKLATSNDGINWEKQGTVLDITPQEWGRSWTSRPSVLYENGIFKLWYDSQGVNEWGDIGYAFSTDGKHFQKSKLNPILKGAANVDVKRIQGKLTMIYTNSLGIQLAQGSDEEHFMYQKQIVGKTGLIDDAFGPVSPMIYINENNEWERIYYGGASDKCYCKNRIFLAIPKIMN